MNRVYVCLLQGSTLGTSLFIIKGYFFSSECMMHVGFKEKKGVWDEDLVVIIVAKEDNLRKKKDAPVGYYYLCAIP